MFHFFNILNDGGNNNNNNNNNNEKNEGKVTDTK
jgi:hypothetical protein